MASAEEIIERLGGPKEVAAACDLTEDAVRRWVYPYGANNRVPPRHWAAVVQFGALRGTPVTPEELLVAQAREPEPRKKVQRSREMAA